MSELRVRKKRGRGKAPKVNLKVEPAELAQIPVFDLLDEKTQSKIAPRLQRLSLKRDESLIKGAPREEEFSPVYFVLSGDLAVYRHRGTGPEAVEEVSVYLTEGELYIQKLHLNQVADHEMVELEVRAMCPAIVLAFTYQELNYLLSKNDAFRDQLSEAIREITRRQVNHFDDDFKRDISSFFVKERLTFARRVKVKRMDICIECDGCYTACRDRHGTDRLGASEVKYGITEIPNNCHNCVVPECIDKCKYGHITRHDETNEIVISDNCVGCAACSKGCSFNAIQMHPVDTLDLARYFSDRDPDARGKQIAQKCDNCTGYEDQACVTACPTGALFQVDGPDLFDYWEQFNVHKNPGFNQVVSPEDAAQRARPWWIAFTLLNLLVISYESLTRVWAPTLCLGHLFHQLGWVETALDFEKPLRAGKAFGHALGYIGSACMLLTQLYTVGRKLAPKLGPVQLWFEVHIWFGFLGFIYGFYHTAFHWREPIAVTTFTLFSLTMISGMVGRYLVFYIPRNQAGRELTLAELEGELQSVNQEIEERFEDRREGYTMMTRLDQFQAALHETSSLQASLATSEDEAKWSASRVLREIAHLWNQHREQDAKIDALRDELQDKVLSGEEDGVIRLLKRRAQLKRSSKRARWMSSALKSYRVIHVGLGQITFIALILHILHALKLIF